MERPEGRIQKVVSQNEEEKSIREKNRNEMPEEIQIMVELGLSLNVLSF